MCIHTGVNLERERVPERRFLERESENADEYLSCDWNFKMDVIWAFNGLGYEVGLGYCFKM